MGWGWGDPAEGGDPPWERECFPLGEGASTTIFDPLLWAITSITAPKERMPHRRTYVGADVKSEPTPTPEDSSVLPPVPLGTAEGIRASGDIHPPEAPAEPHMGARRRERGGPSGAPERLDCSSL